jgi:hypothetical protein
MIEIQLKMVKKTTKKIIARAKGPQSGIRGHEMMRMHSENLPPPFWDRSDDIGGLDNFSWNIDLRKSHLPYAHEQTERTLEHFVKRQEGG